MTTATDSYKPIHWSLLVLTALVITLFLYFIDDGRYSLEGLLTVGNLIAMSFYFVGLIVGLFFSAVLFDKRPPGIARFVYTVMLGSTLGISLTLLFFYVLHGGSLPS